MVTKEELSKDLDWVQACLEEDTQAISRFHEEFSIFLRAFLLKHGATIFETEDIVPPLLADCVVGDGVKPPIFSRYNGQSCLRSWLSVIALNRWISQKRRASLHFRTMAKLEKDAEMTESRLDDPSDKILRTLLIEAIQEAMNHVDPEEVVLLRLVHTHGISQRELAELWGWHESKLSRHLRDSAQKVSKLTLEALKKKDSQLNPRWEDFLEICDHVSDWQI